MRVALVCAALAACRETPAPQPRPSAEPTHAASAGSAPPAIASTATGSTATASALGSTATASAAPSDTCPPAVPPRPDEPRSASRACVRDADCALVPDDCKNAPPCEGRWRTAATKTTVQRMLATRGPCPPITPPPCPAPRPPPPLPPGQTRRACPDPATGWIGQRAVCENGQCVAAE